MVPFVACIAPIRGAFSIEVAKDEIDEQSGLNLKKVSEQIDNEYKVAERFIRAWREQMRIYLKLLLNQRKNPKRVGDTLMFSTRQTILASLYKERLDAEWMYREEEEDEDRAEYLSLVYGLPECVLGEEIVCFKNKIISGDRKISTKVMPRERTQKTMWWLIL